MENEGDCDTNCNWRTCYNPQDKGTGRLGNKRTTRDTPDDSII